MRYAFVGLLLAAPLTPVDETAPRRDVQCEEKGEYIGGINRVWNLKISGPKEKTWAYSFEGLHQTKGSGTYEFDGDLVLFTGKCDGVDVRFGLNYGFPSGTVEFDGFFPVNDKSLRYHRKWFRKVKGEWQPAEELTLELSRAVPKEAGKAAVRGAVTSWDEQGKETRQEINGDIQNLHRDGERHDFVPMKGARLVPATAILVPARDGKLLEAVLPEHEFPGCRHHGKIVRGIPREPCYMHGFQPGLSKMLTDK